MKKRDDTNLAEVESITSWEDQKKAMEDAGISKAEIEEMDTVIEAVKLGELGENKGKKRSSFKEKIRKGFKTVGAFLKKSFNVSVKGLIFVGGLSALLTSLAVAGMIPASWALAFGTLGLVGQVADTGSKFHNATKAMAEPLAIV